VTLANFNLLAHVKATPPFLGRLDGLTVDTPRTRLPLPAFGLPQTRVDSAEWRRPSTGPEKRGAPHVGQRLGGAVVRRWRPCASFPVTQPFSVPEMPQSHYPQSYRPRYHLAWV